MNDIVDWRGHAERLREECEFHLAEIARLEEQVLALQHIADRDEAEIKRLLDFKLKQRAALIVLKSVNENEEFPSVFVKNVIEAALEGK